jgi:hypothetical protein
MIRGLSLDKIPSGRKRDWGLSHNIFLGWGIRVWRGRSVTTICYEDTAESAAKDHVVEQIAVAVADEALGDAVLP